MVSGVDHNDGGVTGVDLLLEGFVEVLVSLSLSPPHDESLVPLRGRRRRYGVAFLPGGAVLGNAGEVFELGVRWSGRGGVFSLAAASHRVVRAGAWFGAPRCLAASVRLRVDAHEPGREGKGFPSAATVVHLADDRPSSGSPAHRGGVVALSCRFLFGASSSSSFVPVLRSSGGGGGWSFSPPLRQSCSLGPRCSRVNSLRPRRCGAYEPRRGTRGPFRRRRRWTLG